MLRCHFLCKNKYSAVPWNVKGDASLCFPFLSLRAAIFTVNVHDLRGSPLSSPADRQFPFQKLTRAFTILKIPCDHLPLALDGVLCSVHPKRAHEHVMNCSPHVLLPLFWTKRLLTIPRLYNLQRIIRRECTNTPFHSFRCRKNKVIVIPT